MKKVCLIDRHGLADRAITAPRETHQRNYDGREILQPESAMDGPAQLDRLNGRG